MQIDPAVYVQLKKNGGVRLMKMGGTEGQGDKEQVDGVAVLYVRKYDMSTFPPTEVMGDMGPLQVKELTDARAELQKRIDGIDMIFADMTALKIATTLPPAAGVV